MFSTMIFRDSFIGDFPLRDIKEVEQFECLWLFKEGVGFALFLVDRLSFFFHF
jgi:hypothetical protein